MHEVKVNTLWNKWKDKSSQQRNKKFKKNQIDTLELKNSIWSKNLNGWAQQQNEDDRGVSVYEFWSIEMM